MLELYHNLISSCSQKVRLVLAEKGLDFKSHEIDLVNGGQHDPEYVKLNPNHVVPTLVHQGAVLIESTLINEYLDDTFPEPAMRPADPAQRHAMRMWTKQIDTSVHPAAGVLTYAVGTRPMVLQRSKEEIEASIAAIPDPARRAARRSVIENGVKAPEFAGAVRAFVKLIDDMEAALAGQPWLSGDAFGLADACALPYVLRLDHLAMGSLFSGDTRAAVGDWLARVQARPSYQPAVQSYLNDGLVGFLRGNGEKAWPDVEPLTRSTN